MNTLDNMEKEDEIKYNAWNDHLLNTRDRTNYAIRRMDLLIISICGAGIYIVLETLRHIATKEIFVSDTSRLKISGILFAVAITINFISQKTGYWASENEEKYTMLELKRIEGKDINESEQKEYDNKSRANTKATNALNWFSIVFMFLGIILLGWFSYSAF